MRVLVVYNAESGRGRGARMGPRLAEAIADAGHEARAVKVQREPGFAAALERACRGAEVLVAVGGDGTLHHAVGPALAAGAAVYHAPLGNENLFARHFGMRAAPEAVLRALDRGVRRRVDVGRLSWPGGRCERHFVLMSSVGFDAGVIHRLGRVRRRAVGHRVYIRPIAAEWLTPSLPRISIRVDGREVVRDRRGVAIVANAPDYGMRLDPARHASMTDGLLDVVFFPASSRWQVLRWALLARLGRHLESPDLAYFRGTVVEVEGAGAPAPVQVDGEAADVDGSGVGGGLALRARVEPGALLVLTLPRS